MIVAAGTAALEATCNAVTKNANVQIHYYCHTSHDCRKLSNMMLQAYDEIVPCEASLIFLFLAHSFTLMPSGATRSSISQYVCSSCELHTPYAIINSVQVKIKPTPALTIVLFTVR